MPSVRTRSPRPPTPRTDDGLAGRLLRLTSTLAPGLPLPTTRELGRRFGVANTTVYRVLRRLSETGAIWQHPASGRYFPDSARQLLDRPKPVACLLRRLELGSALYRELLEGISTGCGAQQRTMLLWHDDSLVNHPDPQEPPAFAPVARQRAILADFLDRHGETAGGFILDHVWHDDALRAHADRLKGAVVLFRRTNLPSLRNVHADFRAGAFQAIGHLLGRSYDRILPVLPFAGDPAVDEFIHTLRAAASELACDDRLDTPAPAGTGVERAALVKHLRNASHRVALLCPEDNVATLLLAALREAGLECPHRVGLLSVMGTTHATHAGLSCLRYDFREIGTTALSLLQQETPSCMSFPPLLIPGQTT